jgi:hypothetical protein
MKDEQLAERELEIAEPNPHQQHLLNVRLF